MVDFWRERLTGKCAEISNEIIYNNKTLDGMGFHLQRGLLESFGPLFFSPVISFKNNNKSSNGGELPSVEQPSSYMRSENPRSAASSSLVSIEG